MAKHKVCLEFVGCVKAEIDADPKDSWAWASALALAFDELTDSAIADAAEFTGTASRRTARRRRHGRE